MAVVVAVSASEEGDEGGTEKKPCVNKMKSPRVYKEKKCPKGFSEMDNKKMCEKDGKQRKKQCPKGFIDRKCAKKCVEKCDKPNKKCKGKCNKICKVKKGKGKKGKKPK